MKVALCWSDVATLTPSQRPSVWSLYLEEWKVRHTDVTTGADALQPGCEASLTQEGAFRAGFASLHCVRTVLCTLTSVSFTRDGFSRPKGHHRA